MQPVQALPQPDHDGSIDFRKLLGTLLDHKWLIAFITALFCLGGAVYAKLATPIYLANALVQIEKKSGTAPGLSEIGDSLGMSDATTGTEIELIRSRTVIGKAVDNLGLDIQAAPVRFPWIGDLLARRYRASHPDALAPPFMGMDEYAWGGESIDVFQLDVAPERVGETFQLIKGEGDAFSLYDGSGALLAEGHVGQAVDGNGIHLQIRELTARPGTHFVLQRLNRLGTIRAYQGALQLSELGTDTGLITVAMTHPEPQHAVKVVDEISRQFVRQNVERMSAEAASSLEFLRGQLPHVRQDLERAEEALNNYRKSNGSVDISLETSTILNQAVALETRISELKMQQAEYDRRYTREHPSYQALMMQIESLTRRQNEIAGKVKGLPETQQEVLRYSRDVQVSTEIYTQLLNKAQELDLVRAGTVGNVRIIDSAVAESGPVAPRKALIVTGSTLFGAALAIAFILVRKQLNPGLETPEAIEHLGLPVYATVPFSERQNQISHSKRPRGAGDGGAALLAASSPDDLAVEALRSLRTSLHFAMLEAEDNRLMISGPSPKVGKSFVSLNLAAVIAQTGKRVLLIDMDMRKGHLHKLLDLKADNGLSDTLSKRCTLDQAIRATPVEGLFLLPRGQIPPNPSELLMHPNFTALLEQTSAAFDLVIFDTPPLLAVTDAAIVGRQAGTSLIVARFGVNHAREIELAVKRFAQNGIVIKGAIFNGMKKRASAYGYGHRYYFQYEYKSDNA